MGKFHEKHQYFNCYFPQILDNRYNPAMLYVMLLERDDFGGGVRPVGIPKAVLS